jgi:hypothetical protein
MSPPPQVPQSASLQSEVLALFQQEEEKTPSTDPVPFLAVQLGPHSLFERVGKCQLKQLSPQVDL